MPAIGKPAIPAKLFDVRKRFGPPAAIFPKPELAHSGRIDHHRALRQDEQLPVRGRMAAAAVALADFLRILNLLAGKPVENRRFARPR
ncbi:hypothetical protein D1872_299920 [compost metagenome]